MNSNIESFNLHAKENVQGLKDRGKCTDDLMINLFKGFMTTSDKEFVSGIITKKDEYDEGKETSEVQLMKLALNRHGNKKRHGEWSAPSRREKR